MDTESFYGLAKNYKVNPLATTAQAIHETGGFRYMPQNNFFGIKYLPWQAKYGVTESKPLATQEYVNGKAGNYNLSFALFSSPAQCLEIYEKIINGSYPICSANLDCCWGYIAGLQGKWATSPTYFKGVAGELAHIAPTLLGAGYKDHLEAALALGVQRHVLNPWEIDCVRELIGA